MFARDSGAWGMSWSHTSRKAAVANAAESCGDAGRCSAELSFFGEECGAFAHAPGGWALAARATPQDAQAAALSDCRRSGRACRVVAAVCADGSHRVGN